MYRGKRNRTQREMNVPEMHSKTYKKGKYKRVGFPPEERGQPRGRSSEISLFGQDIAPNGE